MADKKQPSQAPKSIFPDIEREVLAWWGQENIFQKTLEQTKGGKPFVFFEGPPTANGKPGIHHVLARAYKDVIVRYKTMQGFYVERKAGWDTHGLPVEIQVEKELGISGKPEIEKYGIEAFNKKCRESVWKYKTDLEEMTRKIGFWLDMEHPYVTYENEYIESLWWVIKQIWDKGLLYKGHKVVPHCPRCGTALSSHEVAQGYKSVEENSVYVKFKVVSQENTYILSWTTTPWTLPGNVALAVGKDITYQKIKVDHDAYILAESIMPKLFPEAEVLETLSGDQLVGLGYEPLFDVKPLQKDAAYKVYLADFVNTEEGTGVVHTAVMYGEDDYQLGEKVGLPKHHTVDVNGKFTADVPKWAGKFVKDKDVEKGIVADLKERGLLLKEEMYRHDYPFCWRCGTPLLYYAKDSWFIAVSKVKDALIKNNESINWVPGYIKHGRFGEWLNEVKDWAFSRERYWGTPLPIWECEKCQERECIGSVDQLTERSTHVGASIVFVRHGESEKNILNIKSRATDKYGLTDQGRRDVSRVASQIKGRVDLIISSPTLRTRQTADILHETLGVPVVVDSLVDEFNSGRWEDVSSDELDRMPSRREYDRSKSDKKSWFNFRLGETGETRAEIVERVRKFLKKILHDYRGKRIVVVSHMGINAAMAKVLNGITEEQFYERENSTAPVEYFPMTENGRYVDLHKPFVDEISLVCPCGGTMHRVKEVVDVWFDSGCMPYAQWHYPFENKERIDNGISFPADFIAEGIDQTRGWFYTLLAVATLLGKGAPYKNVVCLNLVFDAKGQKMSKSKGNIVDPFYIIDKFGADTLRWFLFTVNQPGDAKLFDEKQLEEVVKKQWLILWNILSFWKMYAGKDRKDFPVEVRRSAHVLDKWIIAKLHDTVSQATSQMDAYGVTETGRLIADLITELSTWYVRRSRDRFKKESDDKKDALAVLRYALVTISRLLAPFAPFMAEALYREVRIDAEPVSVHIAGWPKGTVTSEGTAILKQMAMVRQAVEMGHSLRKDKQIKVRQPLPQFIIKGPALEPELKTVIQDEVNVKEVISVDAVPQGPEFAVKETGGLTVALDTTITDELKYEGMIREIVRQINAMRKDAKLTVGDVITLYYAIPDPELEKIFLHYKADVCRDVVAGQCLPELPDNVDLKSVFAIAGVKVTFGIKKK